MSWQVIIWRAFGGIRKDERTLFIWCWLLSSFVFLTIARSKLPSYIFFAFVPLALLAGTTLESMLAAGFRNAAERRLVLITAVIQFVAALCAPVIKIAQPFASPALLLSIFLGLAWQLPQHHHFRFSVGYEYEYWWNVGRISTSTPRGEMSDQGILLRAELNF